MVSAYIALGSNLPHLEQTPLQLLCAAIDELGKLQSCRLLQSSSFYQTPALLKPHQASQADFVNAVVKIATSLSPRQLLAKLQRLEIKYGRKINSQQWAARSLDLDILLYAQQVINSHGLQVPHPQLANRNFVLCPLAEIAPNLKIQNLGKVKDLRAKLLAKQPAAQLLAAI